jgi:hypothetical protein
VATRRIQASLPLPSADHVVASRCGTLSGTVRSSIAGYVSARVCVFDDPNIFAFDNYAALFWRFSFLAAMLLFDIVDMQV